MGTEQLRLARAADATVVAELVHAGPDGTLHATVVTPLVTSDRGIVVALPYAERRLADTLGAAEQVALVFSDERMALRGWEPLVVHGHIEVRPDPEGDLFREDLLDQELRKHPPSRVLTDSLRDRRDNWWYLPRLMCHLVPSAPATAVGPRNDPSTGVLAYRPTDGAGLDIETVEVTDADDRSVSLRASSGRTLRGSGEAALLFRHDYSQPDLERRSERRESGRLEGDVLRNPERAGDLALPGPPGLLERFRQHRTLSKACRRELDRLR